MIELLVYKYDDYDATEPLGMIPIRRNPTFLEELKAAGGGSFSIPLEAGNTIMPELLEYRNLVKIRIDNKVVGGFVIGKQDDKTIQSGESGEARQEIAGEGLKVLLDDAVLLPHGGLQTGSGTSRAFNFATEQGSWYNPANWISPFVFGQVGQSYSGAWGEYPEEWPDAGKTAQWIWASAFNTSMPTTTCYFRYEFTTASQGDYAVYAAVDNYMSIWLNGEQLAVSDPKNWDAWKKATKITFSLPAGNHVLAFTGRNAVHSGFNPAGLAMALMQVNGENETLIGRSGAGNWKALPYPAAAPSWTAGEVMLTLWAEAAALGCKFAQWFTPDFTATTDSNGQAWDTGLDWKFDIGESYVSIMAKMEELLCDSWFDLETMEFRMANRRGVDYSIDKMAPDGVTIERAAITFQRGKNLKLAESQGVGKIKNKLVVRTDAGWMTTGTEDATSKAKYGTIMSKLDTNSTPDISAQMVDLVFQQRANPEEGATYEITTFEYVPWRHFTVGDWVLAPNKQNILVKRRIVSISVTEDEAGLLIYTLEFDTIFRDMNDKVAKFMAKTGGGGLSSGLNNAGATPPTAGAPIVIGPGGSVTLTPKAPTGFSATSTGRWTSDGMQAISDVDLNWTDVTQNTDESATVPTHYEVWGFPTAEGLAALNIMATVPTSEASLLGLAPGVNHTFRVRAFNGSGAPGQFSSDFTYTPAGPTTPMNPPSTPDATSEAGLLIVAWNGSLTSGSPPPQFRYAYAEVKPTGSGTFTRMGPAFSRGGGSINIPGLTVGQSYDVRLKAVDGLGVESAVSGSDTVVLTGIALGDLDSSIEDAITAAEEAALDAQANLNLLQDDGFELNTEEFWDWDASVTNVTTSPRSGLRHLRIPAKASAYEAVKYLRPIPCDPGETYQIRMYVKAADTGVEDWVDNALWIGVTYDDTDPMVGASTTNVGPTQVLDTATYTLVVADWTAPAGAYFFVPRIWVADISNNNVYYVDDVRILRMVGTTQVINGAIIAEKVAAGAISATHIQAAAIATMHLQAAAVTAEKVQAGAIQAQHIAAGSVNANHITAGAIQTNHLSPLVGSELDISANNSVNILVGQIDEVAGTTNETQSSLEQMQTYYTFGATGAVISTPASPFATAIRNDRIEMLENGNPVSWWNSGQMHVSQLVGERVTLANHQIEVYGDGTIVRAL